MASVSILGRPGVFTACRCGDTWHVPGTGEVFGKADVTVVDSWIEGGSVKTAPPQCEANDDISRNLFA